MKIRKIFQGTVPEHKILDTTSTSQTDTYSCRKINELVANAGGGTGGSGVSVDQIFPVGYIYMSVNNVDPSTLFPGTTWEQIKDVFLLSAGDTYTAGTTGGEAEHKLTIAEMPSHTHQIRYLDGFSHAGTWSVLRRAVDSDSYKGTDASALATGGSQAHNNMPPYLTVYMWKRVA